MAQTQQRRSDIGNLVSELQQRMEKTKEEREQLQQIIEQMEKELSETQDEITAVTQESAKIQNELRQDYMARKELEQLIDETETAYQKINESIKTLICVVSKQEKHLIVKTGSKQ